MAQKTVVVRLMAAGVGQYTQAFAQAAGATQAAALQIGAAANYASGAASGIARMAGVAGKALIIGLGAGLAISAKAAIDFESSFAGIKKTVDASEEGFERLAGQMRQLALEIPISVNELNRIGELGGQLGIGEEALADFTEVVAKLGVTTTMSTEDAAVALSRLANILGVTQRDFERMGSSLVELGNNFAAMEGEISSFALRIAPIGAVVGMTADEVLALGAAFTSVGIPAERGGTAVQRAFAEMMSAVEQGGEELEVFAETAGLSINEFVRLFRDDAAEAFTLFVEGLGRVVDSGGPVLQILEDVHLQNERTRNSLLAIASAGDLLRGALDMSEAAWKDNLALTEEAEKRFDTTASKMALARNRIYDLRVELGENLLPAVGEVSADVQWLVKWFEELTHGSALLTSAIIAGSAALLLFTKRLITLGLTWRNFARALGRTGMQGAFAALVYVVGDFIHKQREAADVAADLASVLRDQSDAINAVTIASLKSNLVGDPERYKRALDAANDLGISLDTLLRVIAGDADAVAEYNKMVGEIEGGQRRAAQAAEEARQALADQGGTLWDVADAWGDLTTAGDEWTRKAAVLATLIWILGDEERAWGDALEIRKAEQLNASLALQDAIRAALDADRAEQKARTQTRLLGGEMRSLSRESTVAGEALEKLAEAVRELHDAEMEARAGVYDFAGALQELYDAYEALNEEGGNTWQNQLRLSQAWDGMLSSIKNLTAEGIQPAIRNLGELRAAGMLTDEQFVIFMGRLYKLAEVADASMGIVAGTSMSAARAVMEAMDDAGFSLNTLAAAYGNLSAQSVAFARVQWAVAKTVAAAYNMMAQFAAGLSGAAFTPLDVPSFEGYLLGELGNLSTLLSDFGPVFHSAGVGLMGEFADGIEEGGGAVEDEVQKILDQTAEQLRGFTSVIRAAMSWRQAVKDLRDAEKELAALRREQRDLPAQIAEAERELARARRESRGVTLTELKSIQDAEEALKRTRLAQEQGLATSLDVLIAEQNLAQVRADATAENEEVEQLEDELHALRQRQRELKGEITDAEWDLLEAQLAVVEAQWDLIEAGHAFAQNKDDWIDTFTEIAQMAGLTDRAIQRLIRRFARLGLRSYGQWAETHPAPTATTPTAGAATTPAAAAAPTYAGTAAPTAAPAAPAAATSPPPAEYWHGGFQILQGGGVVQGKIGEPVPVIAHGGEVVFNPFASPKGAGSVQNLTQVGTIVLHIDGLFDLRDPTQIGYMVDRVERELIRRGVSVS